MAGLLPEVDLFVGKDACGSIERLVAEKGFFKSCGEGEGPAPAACLPRKVLTPLPTAYLKIQEGCNNRCSYCTIPSIKGPLQSRPPLHIEEEFRELLAGGYREFNVIGQDITSYGRDAGTDIGRLLARLLSIKGDYFIRLLYMHPKGIDDALLDLMGSDDRIIPYLDIPIQHAEDRLLTSMNRGYSRKRPGAPLRKDQIGHARCRAPHHGYGRISGRDGRRVLEPLRLHFRVGVR